MSDPRARENPGTENGQQKGLKNQRVTCPRCGSEYGNLPLHLRSCNGGIADAE